MGPVWDVDKGVGYLVAVVPGRVQGEPPFGVGDEGLPRGAGDKRRGMHIEHGPQTVACDLTGSQGEADGVVPEGVCQREWHGTV